MRSLRADALIGFAIALASGPAIAATPLGTLGDEFNDAATLSQWSRLYITEGWGADQLDTWDIGATQTGAMTLTPHSSVWYNNRKGALAFQAVSGDFIATTALWVRDRDAADGNAVPASPFSIAGLMARAPRPISDPATEWTVGGENYVLSGAGSGASEASFQVETKTTVNSNSVWAQQPITSGLVELQLARIGDTFITAYRAEGANWQIHDRYSRTDLPDTLQLGLVAYADYPTASGVSAYEHNSTVLSGAPDLTASFDWFRVAAVDLPPALLGLDLADAGSVTDAQLLTVVGANGIPSPVPEPATWLSLLAGLFTLGAVARRPGCARHAPG